MSFSLFDEDDGSPKYTYAEGQGTEVTMIGKTDWSQIETFAEFLTPISSQAGHDPGIEPGAEFPGNPIYRCYTWAVEGYGGLLGSDANGINQYRKAAWTIKFRIPKYDDKDTPSQDPVPFLTHEWSAGGEFLTLPDSSVRLSGASVPIPAQEAKAGLFIPHIEHSISWPRVELPPFVNIKKAIGTVNGTPITFDTGPCDSETLLLTGVQLSRDIMSDGSKGWKVTYKFSERIVIAKDVGLSVTLDLDTPFQHTQTVNGGWNHFYLNGTSTGGVAGFWRLITNDLKSIYPNTDFNLLFQAA